MRLLSLCIQGVDSKWEFFFQGDPANIPEWRKDGIDVKEVEAFIYGLVLDPNGAVERARIQTYRKPVEGTTLSDVFADDQDDDDADL